VAYSPGVEVRVRPAHGRDAAALSDLARLAYAPYVPRIGREPAPVTADYAATIGRGGVWVAEVEDRVVGLLVLQLRVDHLLLENVAVAPDLHGTGIGARLLDVAEDQARRHRLPEIRLYTNAAMTENLAYYPRRGYRETHRAVQDGYDRVFFSKTMTPESHATAR
jgi:GNAT superfamily N-acetyltransferase